jgi:hypothetical protein
MFSLKPPRPAAEVIFATDTPPVPCVIWDISDGGARLAIAHSSLSVLPQKFTLVLLKEAGVMRNCQVVWRDARFVGVKFI